MCILETTGLILTSVLVDTHWHVPSGRNKRCVGREAHLEEILTKSNPKNETDDCQRVAIAGLGGISKTKLALKAVFKITKLSHPCSVFWVLAISVATFESAYREIGVKLEVPGLNEDEADVMKLVKQALKDMVGSWLMIVDNADDKETLFGGLRELSIICRSTRMMLSFLPHGASKLHPSLPVQTFLPLDDCQTSKLNCS
jgi:hypothetical protein